MKYVLFNIENYLSKLRKKPEKSWFDELVFECCSKVNKLDFKDEKLNFFTSYVTRNGFKLFVEFRFYYKNYYCYLCVFHNGYKYIINNIYDERNITKKGCIENDSLSYDRILKNIIQEIKNNIDNSDNIDEFNQDSIKIKLKEYARRELILNSKNNYISVIFLIICGILYSCKFNYIFNMILIIFISLFTLIIVVSLFKYTLLLSKIIKDLKELKIYKIKTKVNYLSLASYKYFGDTAMVDNAFIYIEGNYLKAYCPKFFNFIPKEEDDKFKLMLDELENNTYEFIYLRHTKLAIYIDIKFLETIYKYKENVKYSPTYDFLPGFKEFIEYIN